MSDAGAIDRQLRMLRILASRRLGVTVEQLKAELGVSLKTVRRDLDRFRKAGFPLREETEDHGRRRWFLSGESITGSGLGFDEAFALVLAARSIGSLHATALGDAADSAIAKLRTGLSETVLDYCDRLARAIALIHPKQVDYGDKADIIEQLLLGREDHWNVYIAYQSRNSTEPTSYGISPYAIRHYQNSLYVIGYSEMHSEIRTFKVDRISEAEVTEFPFTIPADFDADEYLSSAFGIYAGASAVTVRVRFAATAARAITESQWHLSEQIEPQSDGSVIASYQVALTPELTAWLLSIGPDARVLEPAELIEDIRGQARAITAKYEPSTKEQDS